MYDKATESRRNAPKTERFSNKNKFLERLSEQITESTISRNVTGVSFSIGIHVFVVLFYFGVAALEKPEILEIREISFVDLTETPPEPVKPKVEKVQPIEYQKPDLPSQKETVMAEHKPQPAQQQVPPAISFARRLDMKREQAPIKAQAISLDKSPKAELLQLEVSKGTRDDNRVQRPQAPINLKKSNNLAMPKTPPSKVQMATGAPGIQLAKKSLSLNRDTQTGNNMASFSQVQTEKQSQEALTIKKSGVSITGPLSNRKILEKQMPVFPAWAKQQGVGASISLQFTVMANGEVKENIVVIRTSGSREWDNMVIDALKTWRFVALGTGGRRNDQNGVITFQFVVD